MSDERDDQAEENVGGGPGADDTFRMTTVGSTVCGPGVASAESPVQPP